MSRTGLGSSQRSTALLVWDCDKSPVRRDITILWRGFGNRADQDVISIPSLVEARAETLRARYLAWIHELGESQIHGKRLIDHLTLNSGFSYWWMTALAQKFNASGTSQIENAIKLLVLEEWITEHQPASIELVSDNAGIIEALCSFCRRHSIPFTSRAARAAVSPRSLLRRIYASCPFPIQALAYFLRYMARTALPLLFASIRRDSSAVKSCISFFDILVHLDKKALHRGQFISNYWNSLPETLQNQNIDTNWLHHYFYQPSIPSTGYARNLLEFFTKNSKQTQLHTLVESNLSLTVIGRAIRDYSRIFLASKRLSDVSQYFRLRGSDIDLWPLFKHEWLESLRGPSAFMNSLWLSLYRDVFHGMPYQKIGVYILENQPWEMALIHFWKKEGHGKLIGVPHTTVRFWDLRYFHDPRSFGRIATNSLPLPDLIAVNGPVAKRRCLESGYPAEFLIEAEALRFLHLVPATINHAPKTPSKVIRVLICGDFLAATNTKMLSWLDAIADSLSSEISFVLKPHPACPIPHTNSSPIKYRLTDAPITELLAECDVVFASNATSAAVDAYCAGIPVIQMLDGETFNLSPLQGMAGVMYVTNPLELKDGLYNTARHAGRIAEPYFFLDPQLPRWRSLLGLEL